MNSESLHAANEMKVPKEPNTISTGNCPLIKPSLSMTSLPPDENSRNCGEVLKAKLRDERPYNSLKKKRISQRDSWRHSWGSGHSHHSHSSCSLYSNTTGTGLSSGKDDFWAALQTNYNYIMDTNLMDTCREARCELECETRTVVNTPECCAKMLQPNYSDGTPEDVKGLRRWLREKEDTLAKAPSLFEATHLTTEQLRELLAEHSVLYYDIVSHARVVNACVRSCEKEVNSCCTTDTLYSSSTCTKQLKKSIVSNCEYRATEDNLKGLERRYHLLYLKAIEVQCLFEGLLGKRNSSTVLNRTSSTETDDEPASKVPRYTDVKAPAKHFKGDNFEASSCNRSDIISDELISEGRSRTHLGDQKKTNRRYRHYSKLYTSYREPIGVDFDADSEGSEFDNEVLNNEHKRYLGVQNQFCQKICANKNKNNQLVSNNTMESKFLTERQANLIASKETLLVTNITNSREVASRSTANATIVNLCKTSASTIASAKKRHRIVDISKFNRSNRKSKNCAIFYFKHLDTDNENFGLSSQGSDINKSADPSSDEGWLYSRDCVDGINEVTYDSDKENYTEIANNCSVKLSPSVGSDKSQTHRDVMYSNKSTIMDQVVTSECDSTSIVSDELKDDGKSILKCTPSTVKLTDGNNCELSECGKSPVKMKISSPVNVDTSQDSIRQLVLNADNLIRDDQLKTPTKTHTIVKISSTVKKREIVMSGPNLQKVQEWLEYQPRKEGDTSVSQPTTDCEASGEYTESDSSNVRDSDTSDGPSDSVATCMQTGGSNSQCTSTEKIGGSAEPITHSGSNLSLGYGKVIRRTNKRNCDRPWSVSCLSQLTENDKINGENVTANQGLTTHSISESALHVLSIASTKNHSDSSPVIRTSGSKGSLRRRKPRKRKVTNKRSDSGSDGLIQKLFEQQSISDNMNIIEDITEALSMISLPKHVSGQVKTTSLLETGDEGLAKPNFKIGPVTNPSFPLINESKLGSLAALANYMNEDQAGNYTGTEDHSSFSEQAWDNFQEKYNSENYSEGMDSDAARRLLEFGDDYRNFLDSQSDCCSSLSAANNLDSFSPPQMDSLNTNENKLPQPPPVSTIDHIRRRRALELEYERRREIKKKNSNDELRGNRSPNESSSSINNASVNNERMVNRSFADVVRRLDFRSNSPPHHLKKTSESESNINRRRKSEESSTIRRRISRASDKALKISSLVTSSSNTSSDEEKEVKSLLVQSRKRLEDTNALKIRSHLLRPEDYNEILTTCRDNIDCLGSVLHGASGTVLSTARSNETRGECQIKNSSTCLVDHSESKYRSRFSSSFSRGINALVDCTDIKGCVLYKLFVYIINTCGNFLKKVHGFFISKRDIDKKNK